MNNKLSSNNYNQPYNQFHLIKEGFKGGADLGYDKVDSKTEGNFIQNTSKSFHIIGKVSYHTKNSLETGNIIYLHVANFINNNKNVLTGNKESIDDLKEFTEILDKKIEQIKSNTKGVKAFFRYLFNPESKNQKIQQQQYLETLSSFVSKIVQEKEKRLPENDIKDPLASQEGLRSEKEENFGKEPSQSIPTKESVKPNQAADVNPAKKIPEPTIKEESSKSNQQTNDINNNNNSKITNVSSNIPPPPPLLKNGIPPPFGMSVKAKRFADEPEPLKIPLRKDLTDLSKADTEKEIKEIKEYTKLLDETIARLTNKTNELQKNKDNLAAFNSNIEGFKNKLMNMTNSYNKLKADQDQDKPESKMAMILDKKKEEVSFYSDTEFDKRKQGPASERPQNGQKRSVIVQAYQKKLEGIQADLDSDSKKVEELKSKIEELSKKDGDIDVGTLKDKELRKIIDDKKEISRKWKLQIKIRANKLAGKEDIPALKSKPVQDKPVVTGSNIDISKENAKKIALARPEQLLENLFTD